MPKIATSFYGGQPGDGENNYIDGGPVGAGLEQIRSKLNSAPMVFSTVEEAEAAEYQEPESVVISETNRVYIYSSASDAARNGITVLHTGGTGRLLMAAPQVTDTEIAAMTRIATDDQTGLMSAVQAARLSATTIWQQDQLVIGSADWEPDGTVTVAVGDMTESSILFVSPDPDSLDIYSDSGIRVTAQRAGELDFFALAIPVSTVIVNIIYSI
jgi:hypothetical protein